MKITFLGHATVLIESNHKKILVDPFISVNSLASHINIDEIKCDYIFVTHGHQDHILDVRKIHENNPEALLVSNYEIVNWFEAKGIKGHPLNHGGKYDFDFGTAKYVNAVHTSGLPDGSYGGNPGGFVIYNEHNAIYIAGDTALTKDMELIPLTCPKLDVAILPIGDNFTMGYEDACVASDFIDCDKIIGCHYDTFPPIEIDKGKAVSYFEDKGKQLMLLEIGESIVV
jgi:L-ascorbate metabolism protein UlaG (beta-lactamase superfamily)